MAVDAGSIVGKLDLDISGFQSKLNQAASTTKSSMDSIESASKAASDNVNSSGKRMFSGWSGTLDEAKDKAVNVFGGISTAAKIGLGAAAVGVVGFVKTSVDAYSNCEQLSGGIQKLYGNMGMSVEDYARVNNKSVSQVQGDWERNEQAQQKVFDNASQAYKTAGMSANDYMQQATTFSAKLIKDLGGNTEKAADVTDVAIRAMSDNYNTFGGNIEDIQNAFNGFAKQNYSMLDNLKLGYGGTKEEMQHLIDDANTYAASIGEASNLSIDSFADVVKAIELIQEKQQIAGTTAREASTTLEGSFNSMKASWTNFAAEFGKDDGDIGARTEELVESVATYLSNLIPRVGQIAKAAFDALPKAIEAVKDKLPGPINAIIDVIGALGPAIVGIVTGISTVVEAIKIGKKIEDLTNGIKAMFAVLEANPVLAIIALIAAVAAALTTLYMTNEDFRNGVNACFKSISDVVGPIIEQIAGALKQAADWFMNNIWPTLQDIGSQFMELVEAIGNRLSQLFDWLQTAFGPFVESVVVPFFENLKQVVQDAFKTIGDVIKTALDIIEDILKLFTDVVNGDWGAAWDDLKTLASDAWNGIGTVIGDLAQGIVDLLKTIFQPLIDFFTGLWNVITSGISDAWSGISQFFSDLGNGFVTLFTETIPNALAGVVQAIADWITSLPDQAAQVGSQFCDAVADFFMNLPERIGEAIGLIVGVVIGLPIALAELAIQVGADFCDAVVNFFQQLPGKISNFLSIIISNVGSWVTQMASNAQQAGSQFVQNVVSFFQQLPGKIANFLSNIISNVGSWVTQMASKAMEAGSSFLQNIVSFFQQLPGSISNFIHSALSAIASFPSNLANIAKNAAQQFLNNIRNGMNNAVNFVRNIPSRILGALGNLGSLLFGAGRSIIDGFLRGLRRGFDSVKNFVGGIAGWIKSHKGPEQYDKQLLVENGGWIIQSLDNGLEKNFQNTEKEVSKYGERLKDAFGNFSSKTSKFGSMAMQFNMPDKVDVSNAAMPSSMIDYDLLAEKMIDVLRIAPIQPQVDVSMEDGDVYMDSERVGRKVAPVISRVQAKKVKVSV